MINGLTGSSAMARSTDGHRVDLSSKPLVKVDLDFQRLDIANTGKPAAPSRRRLPRAGAGAAEPIDVNRVELYRPSRSGFPPPS